MNTDSFPAWQWLVLSGVCFLLSSCSPTPSTPPTRHIDVSISFSWKDGKSERPSDIEVGAVPFDKARTAVVSAVMRRDTTVNMAWREKTKRGKEIEKLNQEMAGMGIASDMPSFSGLGDELKKNVDAARDALNNLADTAVLYFEDVKKQIGGGTDDGRLDRFQKNLGAGELRDLALAIKPQNSAEVRKAIGQANEILSRDVWKGKPQDQEHTRAVLSALGKALAGSLVTPKQKENNPKAIEDLKERILAVVKDQMSWDNEVAMANRPIRLYTAVPDAEVRAKTDGDGKCHLVLPREGRWVISACVERPFPRGMSEMEQSLRIKEKEEMCWIVEAPGIGAERASLTLSDNNAIRPGVAPLKIDSKGQ